MIIIHTNIPEPRVKSKSVEIDIMLNCCHATSRLHLTFSEKVVPRYLRHLTPSIFLIVVCTVTATPLCTGGNQGGGGRGARRTGEETLMHQFI